MGRVVAKFVGLFALAGISALGACSGNPQKESTLQLSADRDSPFARNEPVTLIAKATNRDGTPGEGEVRFRTDDGTFDAAGTALRDTTVVLSGGLARVDLICGDTCPQTVGVSATWKGTLATFRTQWEPATVTGGGSDGGDGGAGDAGGGPDAGDGGVPTLIPQNCDTFNPDHVYILSTVYDTPFPGTVISWQVLKDLEDSQNTLCPRFLYRQVVNQGFGTEIRFAVRSQAHDIVYFDNVDVPQTIQKYEKDPMFYSRDAGRWFWPSNDPELNDPQVVDARAVCTTDAGTHFPVDDLKVIPGTDDVLYLCNRNWWLNNGPESRLGIDDTRVWPGPNQYLLVFQESLSAPPTVRVVFPDGGSAALPDIPSSDGGQGAWQTDLVRATADGWLAVHLGDLTFLDGGGYDIGFDQYSVGLDGSTQLNGRYVQTETDTVLGGQILAKNGDLIGRGIIFPDAGSRILRFSLTAPPVVLYRDSAQPPNNFSSTPPNLYIDTGKTDLLQPFFSGP